jgi:hypothetical protein
MATIAPPDGPPVITLDDGDGLPRVQFRLQQILATALTVFVTGWFCTLGVIPAIVALMIAKHVLVAILVVGLELGPSQDGKAE